MSYWLSPATSNIINPEVNLTRFFPIFLFDPPETIRKSKDIRKPKVF